MALLSPSSLPCMENCRFSCLSKFETQGGYPRNLLLSVTVPAVFFQLVVIHGFPLLRGRSSSSSASQQMSLRRVLGYLESFYKSFTMSTEASTAAEMAKIEEVRSLSMTVIVLAVLQCLDLPQALIDPLALFLLLF